MLAHTTSHAQHCCCPPAPIALASGPNCSPTKKNSLHATGYQERVPTAAPKICPEESRDTGPFKPTIQSRSPRILCELQQANGWYQRCSEKDWAQIKALGLWKMPRNVFLFDQLWHNNITMLERHLAPPFLHLFSSCSKATIWVRSPPPSKKF